MSLVPLAPPPPEYEQRWLWLLWKRIQSILPSSGILPVASGGTGADTLTGMLKGNGTSAVTAITDSSTTGQILRVTGAATYAWGPLAPGDIPTGVVVAFGLDGEDGEDGLSLPGATGATGAAGATGATGAAGTAGAIGPPGMDGESADSENLRGFPSGYPLYAPFAQVGAALNFLKVDTVVNLTVPVYYSLVVAGDYIVDGNLIVDGDMRVIG